MYLCTAFGNAVRLLVAAQHSSSELGPTFALHNNCNAIRCKGDRQRLCEGQAKLQPLLTCSKLHHA